MAFSTEEIQTILKEVVLGMPASIRTPEALAFRRKLMKEVRERPKGTIIEIPTEIEGPESNEEHDSLIGR